MPSFAPTTCLRHITCFSGTHSCFYLQAFESKACIMQAVQVSRDDPLELHGMSLFSVQVSRDDPLALHGMSLGFAFLESRILQRMTLISCLGQSTKGWDRWSLLCPAICLSLASWESACWRSAHVPTRNFASLDISVIRSPERIRLLESDIQKPNSQKADG